MSDEYPTTHDAPSDYLSGIHTPLADAPTAPEPEQFSGDNAGLDRATEELKSTRAERNVVVERAFNDGVDPDKAAPGHRTVSPEYAATKLQEARDAEAYRAQAEIDAATAREVDEFRGQQPQAEQPQVQPELQPQPEAPPTEQTELDRMLAELPEARRAPFVAAFNEMVSRAQYQASTEYQQAVAQAQAVAQQYQAAAAQAIQVGEAVARQPFPELHNVPDAELPAVLGHIARTNPQRHAAIVGHVAQVKQALGQQLHAAQVIQHQQTQAQLQQQQQQVEAQRQHFQRFADYHDARVAAEPPEVANEIVAMAEEHGVSKQELLEIYNTNPVMRHSAFQQMMADAAKYRLAQRSVARAATHRVPQVQRPGVASEEARDHGEYAHLERQFRGQSLTPKQAAELVIARRGRR